MSVNRIRTQDLPPPATREDVFQAGKAIHDKLRKDLQESIPGAVKGYAGDLAGEIKALEERHARRLEALAKRLEEREDNHRKSLQDLREAHARELAELREESRRAAEDFRGLVKSIPTGPGLDGDAGTELVLRVGKMLEGKIATLAQAVKSCEDGVATLKKDFNGGLGLVRALTEALPAPVIHIAAPEVVVPPTVVNLPPQQVTVDVKPAEVNVPPTVVNVPEFGIPAPVVNFTAPEAKTLPAPEVKVIVPRRLVKKTFTYDEHQRPLEVIEEEIRGND